MPGYTDTMDPMRLQPVSMITAHQGADACVCELTDPLDLSQPTVVHHLTVLKHAGFSPEASAAARPITRSSPNSLDAAAATLMTA
ncbi:MAG: helix-turn-helix transcriptional regulator [Micrococcales bacterium]|nr:helix-turn-helix transcriptional regulator [Micrococcales bacterium]